MNRTGEGSRPCTSPYHAPRLADKHSACTNNLQPLLKVTQLLVSTTRQGGAIHSRPRHHQSPAKGPR